MMRSMTKICTSIEEKPLCPGCHSQVRRKRKIYLSNCRNNCNWYRTGKFTEDGQAIFVRMPKELMK